jgi:glycosyltransferase involved in cell wall biosynthesis
MTEKKLIIEIGHLPYFKKILPSQTIFVSVGGKHELADFVFNKYDLLSLKRFYYLISSNKNQLIVCRINNNPNKHWSMIRFILLSFFNKSKYFDNLIATKFFKTKLSIPFVILDFEDENYTHLDHYPLINIADIVFKRELPVNRLDLVRNSKQKLIYELISKRYGDVIELIKKFRPLPLGLPLKNFGKFFPIEKTQKKVDIFFSGSIENNFWIRNNGYEELAKLSNRGIIIDFPSERLPPEEFYKRCARAWLVWSPVGYGWDCFRHYEASACGSVPLISYPTIERHAGLIDGVHAIFYDPSPGSLTNAAIKALENRVRLEKIAESGRIHVYKHHTPKAIAAYILSTINSSSN